MYDELVKALRRLSDWSIMDFEDNLSYANQIAEEAADAIEELNKLLNGVHDAHNEGFDVGYWAGRRDYEPKWTPVTEGLPKESGYYQTWTPNIGCERLHFSKKHRQFNYYDSMRPVDHSEWNWGDCVTHWMPLPKPPKEET